MKNFKIISVVLALVMIVLSFSACGSSSEKDTYTVGIIQFGSHPSLDNCYTGIMEGIQASSIASKITVDLQNGNFSSETCDQIAKNMVAKKYDLIYAIATPAAVSAYAATYGTDIPVIFCAVSDPLAAGLVESTEKPGGNCTGTSDVIDLAAQVSLIKSLQPNATKIGALYTTSEVNSLTQLKLLQEVAAKVGMTVEAIGIQTAADIPQAATTLASKVDLINNFTDNNVVNNLQVVLEKANAAGVPVYGSEVEQVKNGCIASISIDYIALGKVTGEMGIKALTGTKAGDIPVGQISEGTPVVNTEVMSAFSITLPDSYANAEKVTTNK